MATSKKNKKSIKLTPPRSKLAAANRSKSVPTKPPTGFRRLIEPSRFAKQYAIFAIIVLLATTTFWALLSAGLQQNNSDQLVNSFLFENSQTFHGSSLPGAHSFLFKWPIFWLVHSFGATSNSFIVFTVLITLATVAALALIIYRIERRPLIFGTLCLALASCLLLVPAMPYAGGLLPVNMAMLATRNLEYIVYLMVLVLLARAGGLKTKRYWLAVVLFSALAASDKLFLSLSLGGALLALVVYALANRWDYVKLSVNWLTAGLAGGILAAIWLWLADNDGVVHIAGQSTANPYSSVAGLHNFALAAVYAVLGTLTNFGANPAFDSNILRGIPHDLSVRLVGLGGPGFAVNFIVLILGGLAVWKIAGASLRTKPANNRPSGSVKLSLMLVSSTAAALLAFVLTSHYYSADARYLTIGLFAIFISLAVYMRQIGFSQNSRYLATVGAALTLVIILSVVFVDRTYNSNRKVFVDINQRNSLIAEAVSRHPVASLVGDYWRVMPIKLASKGKLRVSPLDSCFSQRTGLNSSAWQANLNGHSFAYLLTLQGSLTDYKGCSLNEVIDHYGRPNTSVLIAGNYSKPKELLLFYDRGIHKSAPQHLLKTPSTVLPISLDELPYTSCPVPTIMNIVAHEDDDLLFMNPDLAHDITAGHCVRTVYITAGDSGSGQLYWLSRQQGSEAAYSMMAGQHDIWIDRIVKINSHEYITVANPRGNPKISLIFLHLPDGNQKGQGFASTKFQALAKLAAGNLGSIDAVDGQSGYSSTDLTNTLTSLMHIYQPAEVRTQSTMAGGQRTHDHSDHNAVGGFTKKAYDNYEQQQYEGKVTVPIEYYMGYPVRDLPANLSTSDLQLKTNLFLTYGQHDGDVCHSQQQCHNDQAYGSYLPRQYQNSY